MDKDLSFDEEEFVEPEGEENHLKGALIALLVIATICSLIIISIILLTPSINYSEFNIENYEINEILNSEFEPKLFNGTWISGHELLLGEEDGSIVIFDANNKNISILVPSFITRQYNTRKYSLSADRSYVLLNSEYKKTQHLTWTANFVIFNVETGDIIQLGDLIETGKISIQWAEWGPIGNLLIFINNNDIHYIRNIGEKVQSITNNGKESVVFNGISDLLYRENILSKESLLWSSKEGTNLCYANIDNSGVADSTLVFYGSLDNNTDIDSLKFVRFKYPKAKQKIGKTSLWVYNFNSSVIKQIIPPKILLNKDFYLTYVNWVNDDLVSVIWSPRNQNHSIVSSCSANKNWICEENIKISSALSLKKLSQSIITSNDGLKYFMICLRPDSKIGDYYHIISFRLDEKFAESFKTFGRFDVTRILYFDQLSQVLYFEAKQLISQSIAENKHIFKVKINDSKAITKCITCELSFPGCQFFESIFSSTAQYYILQCLGPDIPKTYLLRLGQESNQTLVLETNPMLEKKMQTKLLLSHQIFSNISNDKNLHIKLLLPIGFDSDVIAKYPLIIQISDPREAVLEQRFNVNWAHHLVSKYEYIFGWVQTLKIGPEYPHLKKATQNFQSINENIENYGIAFNYIKDKLLFIDSKRICIYGTNIGAFVALSSLASNKVINCGVFVSPIIDWKLIDSVTYEKIFNGWTLSDNYLLFDAFTLINKINKLIAKNILVIHGSADEKVSVQHSMQLIKQLTDEYSKSNWNSLEPLIQIQIYPDEDNSLHAIRHHMFKRIHLFFEQTFCKNHRTDIKRN